MVLNSEQAKFANVWPKLVLAKHNMLTPSHMSQLHLMSPTTTSMAPGKTRYPVIEVKQFHKNVVDLGLADSNNRKDDIQRSSNG